MRSSLSYGEGVVVEGLREGGEEGGAEGVRGAPVASGLLLLEREAEEGVSLEGPVSLRGRPWRAARAGVVMEGLGNMGTSGDAD